MREQNIFVSSASNKNVSRFDALDTNYVNEIIKNKTGDNTYNSATPHVSGISEDKYVNMLIRA